MRRIAWKADNRVVQNRTSLYVANRRCLAPFAKGRTRGRANGGCQCTTEAGAGVRGSNHWARSAARENSS